MKTNGNTAERVKDLREIVERIVAEREHAIKASRRAQSIREDLPRGGFTKAAIRVATDKDMQNDLAELVAEARKMVAAARGEKSHRLRKLLFPIGLAAAIAYVLWQFRDSDFDFDDYPD